MIHSHLRPLPGECQSEVMWNELTDHGTYFLNKFRSQIPLGSFGVTSVTVGTGIANS